MALRAIVRWMAGFARLIRLPNLIIIVLTMYMVAVFLVGSPDYLYDPRLLLLSVSTACIAAAGYVINDYYDIKIDYINKPGRVVVGRIIKRRAAMALHIAINAVAIGVSFFLGWKITLIYVVSAILLWFYSRSLKREPLLGNFLVSALTAATALMPAVYYGSDNNLVALYAIFAFTMTLIREIIKDMEDLKGDASSGRRTLPVIWGVRKTKAFIYYFIAAVSAALIVFAAVPERRESEFYFLLFIAPLLYLAFRLFRADAKLHYHRLSQFCKFIMVAGIITMMFF